jgi:hypothetical protein
LFLLIYKNFWVYGKTFSYYGNFTDYAIGKKTEEQYRSFFDWYVNRDYKVASYIKENSNPTDTLFIWGDNAQIYALSKRLPVGRYTVAYHVSFYHDGRAETIADIARKKPAFILQIREDLPKEFIDKNYEYDRTIDGVVLFKRKI